MCACLHRVEEFAETAKAGDSYRIFTSAPLASFSLGEIVSEESISNGNIEEGGTGKGIERKERGCLVLVRTIFFFSLFTPLSEYIAPKSDHLFTPFPPFPCIRLSVFLLFATLQSSSCQQKPPRLKLSSCVSYVAYLRVHSLAVSSYLFLCVCVCVCVYRVTRKHRRQHKIMGQWVSITQSEKNENLNL